MGEQAERETDRNAHRNTPPPQYSGKDILVKIYLPRMKVIAGFAVPVQALIDYRSDLSNTVTITQMLYTR